MTTLREMAKIESNGKIKAISKSATPEVDGYDIALKVGPFFHLHPEATEEYWEEFKELDLNNLIEILPPVIISISPEDQIKELEIRIQNRLDSHAKSWGYDSLISASSYSSSSNLKFKAEAAALIQWRDRVWEWGNLTLSQIKSGAAQIPSDLASVVNFIPTPPDRPV